MKRIAVSLLLMILASCAGQRPDAPQAAAVIPPPAWRDGGTAGEQAVAWWRGFGDPVLSNVVVRALANNVDIAIAATRVEEARAQFGVARGQLLPSVEVGAGSKRERFLNAFGQSASQTAERAEIGVSYDLDLFGRLRNSSEASRCLT